MKNQIDHSSKYIGAKVATPSKANKPLDAQAKKDERMVEILPGLTANKLIGEDVSALDRRSVKAQLAGRGDGRAFWFNLNCWVQQRIFRQDLEQSMNRFHSIHRFFGRVQTFCVMLARDFACQHRELTVQLVRFGYLNTTKNRIQSSK